MASIKQRIWKAVFDLNNIFIELLQEVVLSTKTLSDLSYQQQQQQQLSQSTLLQMQVYAQRESILGLTNQLIQKDYELQLLLEELREHQQFQQEIVQLQEKVKRKDELLTHLSQTLQTTHSKLLEVLHETKPILNSICASRTKVLKMKDVLSYSNLISGTTTGSNFDIGIHLPPYPEQPQWNRSLLYPSKYHIDNMCIIMIYIHCETCLMHDESQEIYRNIRQ